VAAAHLNERWLLEALLSARGGDGELRAPQVDPHAPKAKRPSPPLGCIGSACAAGRFSGVPLLVDRGLNGRQWLRHWRADYAAEVVAIPALHRASFTLLIPDKP
jgi:hypothetical protein